jgi:peptidylprolyl isomerase
MKRIALLLAISGAMAAAQTPTTPVAPAPKPATSAAKPSVSTKAATTAKTGTAAKAGTAAGTRTGSATGIKLPPGVPPAKGLVKSAFTLRYQDTLIGSGAVAEPNKMYKVNYTGWLASDGRKFDSSFDHRAPVMDKDGKPEKDADGKPVLGEPQPFTFPQGFGRLIAGWDQGFEGMKIGGKRRLFIPWELAYGVRGVPARDADHPGIPPKSDLIFDIELLDVTDMPARPAPGAPGMRPMPTRPGAAPSSSTPTPGAPATPSTAPSTAAPAPASPSTAPSTVAPAPATPAPASPPADKPANPEPPK